MFTVESLRKRIYRKSRYENVRRITCKDGFSVSIQASEGHYCSPRDSYPDWTTVEMGFPSQAIPEFLEWSESGDADETQTVWGYVPIEKIVALLNSHGGE